MSFRDVPAAPYPPRGRPAQMLWACPCGGPPVAERYLLLIDTHTQSTSHQRWLSTLIEPLIVPTRTSTPDTLGGEAESKSRDPDTREFASHNLLGLPASPAAQPRPRAAVPVRDLPPMLSHEQDSLRMQALERRVHDMEAFLGRMGYGGKV